MLQQIFVTFLLLLSDKEEQITPDYDKYTIFHANIQLNKLDDLSKELFFYASLRVSEMFMMDQDFRYFQIRPTQEQIQQLEKHSNEELPAWYNNKYFAAALSDKTSKLGCYFNLMDLQAGQVLQ